MEKLLKQQLDSSSTIQRTYRLYKKEGKARKTKTGLQNRIRSLNEQWAEFKERHKEIVVFEQKEITKELEEYLKGELYSEVQETYLMAISEIEEEILALYPPEIKTLDYKEQQTVQSVVMEKDDVRLPRISPPKLNGDYKAWASFHDIFVALIHSNKSLPAVQKLHYLKSSLQGEAEQLLRHFTITDSNYLPAWSTLKDRYDNPRILIKTQLKTLFSQPYANKDSASAIRKLVDTTNECVQSLENLKVDTKGWDIILSYLVTDRLPPETKKLWEQHIGSQKEFPTFEELKTFLEGQFRALESLNASSKIITQPPKMFQGRQSYHIAKTYNCVNCSGSHPLRQCSQFLRLDFNGRRTVVKEKGLCSNCLGQGHISSNCPSKGSCFICKHRHHTLLHDKNVILQRIDPSQAAQAEASTSKNQETSTNAFHIGQNIPSSEVLLATALVKVHNALGTSFVVRALIDPGSQMTFVTENVVQRLRLRGVQVTASIKGLGNKATAISKKRVEFTIRSLFDPQFNIAAQALVLSELTDILPSQRFVQSSTWKHLRGLALADPQFNKPGRIDVIIGADIYCKIILEGLQIGPPGAPIAQNTRLGWILSGEVGTESSNHTEVTNLHNRFDTDDQLRKFWELEELVPTNYLTADEKLCEEFFKKTVKRLPSGRYEVRLPFKNETRPMLGRSHNKALSRLRYLEIKFNKDPAMQTEYSRCLEEYIELNHMSPVATSEKELIVYDEQNGQRYLCCYLPHHAVFKESTTTKLRVVFDASSKTECGTSLNDTLLVGPKLQDDIFSILLRWRKHCVVFTADVEKMYRQIRVAEEDAQYQRILWRPSRAQPVKEYYLNTVTFGTACAPYLAIKTIQQLALDENHRFPLASNVVQRDFYVDDVLTGTDCIEQGLKLQNELINLFKAGGFNLRKWTSNKSQLLQNIPLENREINDLHSIDLHNGIKTLGILWCPNEDCFKYKITLVNKTSENTTKRQFLSDLAKIFDPLGFLVPVIIQPKIWMQALWLKGIEWDEYLPQDILRPWTKFCKELVELEGILIPRWIQYSKQAQVFELHGFCDSSVHAYAAAIYARVIGENGEIQSILLAAKSKVAPVKQISLPRLELCGATLLTRLYSRVREAFNLETSFYAWTDSSIVLSWLRRHPGHWKVFVANRVSEVQSITPIECWRYVPTDENPADCATRGLSPKELKEHQLWWEGPVWLKLSKEHWPQKFKDYTTDLEVKVVKVHLSTKCESAATEIIENFSSLSRLLRVTALCFRFQQLCLKRKKYYMDKPRGNKFEFIVLDKGSARKGISR